MAPYGDWLFSPGNHADDEDGADHIFLKPHILTAADLLPRTPIRRVFAEGSLSRDIALARLKNGVFDEAREKTTIFEEEAAEKKAKQEKETREKAEEEAAAKAEAAAK